MTAVLNCMHWSFVHSFNPFPCGIGPFGPGSLCFNTTQRGSILKIWKNYVIHGSGLSLIFIFRCFIKKCYFIPVVHGFLGPTPKSWAIWPNAALWTIFNKCGKNSLKKSGRVQSRHFIKRLWASQTSEGNLYKTKVVPFEKILKSVNKIKIGQFLTKLWPF